MAKKLSAQELREQANKMLEEAQKLEDQVAVKVGKLVMGLALKGFKGFDQGAFIADVQSLITGTPVKKPEVPKHVSAPAPAVN